MRAAMRELLPTRRHSVTFDMKFGEHTADYTITLGFYDDGRLGEIFIDGGKSGSDIGAVTHDAAVLPCATTPGNSSELAAKSPSGNSSTGMRIASSITVMLTFGAGGALS